MEETIEASNRLLVQRSRWAVGLSIGTAALLVLGSIGLVSRVIRPVLTVTRAAQAFGDGNLAARSPVLHDDELGTLAVTFNNMAADIAQREQERLRFVAMVVHDLKNPAYAIEMAARQLRNAAVDPKKHRVFLDAMHEEATRLRSIVRDLTDDIQVAGGRFSVQKQEVDLVALVRHLIQRRAATSWDREITVEADGACLVQADPARMERVVSNLLSNAVKYSPRGAGDGAD